MLHLIRFTPDAALPGDCLIEYDLLLHEGEQQRGIADWAPHLLHDGATRPSLSSSRGSTACCTAPVANRTHAAADGLLCVDELVRRGLTDPDARPAVLLMTGDQVYADDVAGPMLVAIHALMRRLGLYGEHLQGAVVDDSDELLWPTRPPTTGASNCCPRSSPTRRCANASSAVWKSRCSPPPTDRTT